MITDSLESLPTELECEVCVAGAGPAGITLALELAAHGRRVLLVEGGGLDAPGPGEGLYEGTTDGRPYPMAGSRLRWLGGTSNHWGGWVKPLDAADFMDKPHFPMPGWPLGAADLAEGYRRAADWCEVSADRYDAGGLDLVATGVVLDTTQDPDFENHVFRFSPPTRFGHRYREALESNPNIDCRLHLNLIALDAGDNEFRAAHARTLAGGRCRIRARFFVLAMGGLENARFLLNQNPVPGNAAGLVGRCFMDHFGFTPGLFMMDGDVRYERVRNGDDDIMPVLAPTAGLIREAGLANACMMLSAQAPDLHLPPEYWDSPVFSRRNGRDSEAVHHRVVMINEPMPHPASRVELTDQTDDLGLRRLHLHWHLPEADFDRPLALFERLIVAAGRNGWGRAQWINRQPRGPEDTPGVGFHHMGTTRMSADPDAGVVDADCRVWDQDNLYLAGSSVFATAGYANPTLTIVALASRLAGHLESRLVAT